jgi:hypothetical protein
MRTIPDSDLEDDRGQEVQHGLKQIQPLCHVPLTKPKLTKTNTFIQLLEKEF